MHFSRAFFIQNKINFYCSILPSELTKWRQVGYCDKMEQCFVLSLPIITESKRAWAKIHFLLQKARKGKFRMENSGVSSKNLKWHQILELKTQSFKEYRSVKLRKSKTYPTKVIAPPRQTVKRTNLIQNYRCGLVDKKKNFFDTGTQHFESTELRTACRLRVSTLVRTEAKLSTC